MPFKYSLGARAILNECKQKGLVRGPNSGYVPVPGNIVVWWRNSPTDWRGHIGFVEDATDGFIATIEGNKTDAIRKVRYKQIDIGGLSPDMHSSLP